jgi:hypothetical protein
MIWVLSVGPRPNLQAARISGITSDRLRGDRALHALLGIARFPGDDTVPTTDYT